MADVDAVRGKGQKRQLSPSDETERKINKVTITSDSMGRCRIQTVDLSNVIDPWRKPRRRSRQSNGGNQPNRPEALISTARKTLTSNFKTLKEEMDALQIVRILKKNGIVNEDFFKKFKAIKTRREKVEALLTELDRLMTEGDDARKLQILPEFIEALQESDQDELVTVLKSPSSIEELKCTLNDAHYMFRFLHNAKEKIIEAIEPRRFLDDVVTIQGINLQEYNDITNKSEREDRVRELLLKISKAHTPLRIIKPMCDWYSDLYSNFKSSETTETANINEKGMSVAVRYDSVPETIAQQDTNEHSHFISEIRKLQQRIVDTGNNNPVQSERLQEDVYNDAKLLLSRLSLSSVKLHLRTTSGTSLEDLKECCRNGKAIAWLMSLLKPDDIEKLKELEATNGRLECYIDDEDSKMKLFDESFEECLCVLNRRSLENNLISFQDDLDGLELIFIDILLESKILDAMLAKSLSHAKVNADELGTKCVLTKFLLQEKVPQTCFCIIEKELVRNMKSSTIQQLQQKMLGCPDLYAENVETTVRKNLKENADLLEEELDARWFLASLKSRTEKKYLKIVREIEMARSRKSRTKPFVRFLCEEEDVEWFVKELEECNPHVLAILSQQKDLKESSVFRNAMLSVYNFIIKEVEPLELKSHLRASCMEQLQFGDIENIHDRQERAFFFMKQLFRHENLDRVLDVMDAFASTYTNIENAIKDVLRRGTTCQHYRCPRIERHQMKMSKYIFTDVFTLPVLEKTGSDVETVMQPPKLDIPLQEGSSQEKLVGVSNDEAGIINKVLLLNENSSSDKQAVEEYGSCCDIQITADKAVEIPEESSPEPPLSSSSRHLSETKYVSDKEIRTLNSLNDINKEQKQREMITEVDSSKEDDANIVNMATEKISFYKSKDETEIEENNKKPNCEERERKTNKKELKLSILEPFPTLTNIHSNEKQLPKISSSSEFDEQYVNEHMKCIPRLSKERSIESELSDKVSSKTPSQTMIKQLMSEITKVENDPFANDDLKECQDVQLLEWPLKRNKDTTTNLKDIHSKTSDQTLSNLSGSQNYHIRRSADSCHKSTNKSPSKTDVVSSAPIRRIKSTSDAKCIDRSTTELMSVEPKQCSRKYKAKLSSKPNANRMAHEFHSFRRNKPDSGNLARQYENFGQQRYKEFWKDIERRRRQDEHWYRYYEWFRRIRMSQPVWHRQNTWMKHYAHKRGYTYPPAAGYSYQPMWNRQYCNYGLKGNEMRMCMQKPSGIKEGMTGHFGKSTERPQASWKA